MPETLLSVTQLASGYGDVQVLWSIDVDVGRGEMVCIVGSNGAGKTTLLRTISGMIPAISGSIRFDGQELTGASADKILGAGIAHVPEGRRLFKGLTVKDNLLLGAFMRHDKQEIARDLDYVFDLFPILKERERQDATTLSGGEQQMCAIARGIMSRPKLLMIDELSLGLAPRMVEKLSETLVEINRNGLTILLVEQDVMTAFELAQRAFVIETGRVSTAGTTEALAGDPAIREAYLGM
jgi:branched-chain amino acid transport system ATP-binding protein